MDKLTNDQPKTIINDTIYVLQFGDKINNILKHKLYINNVEGLITNSNISSYFDKDTITAIENKLEEYGLRLHMSENALTIYTLYPHSILHKGLDKLEKGDEKLFDEKLIRLLHKKNFYSLIDFIKYGEEQLFTRFGISPAVSNQLKEILPSLGLHLQMSEDEINTFLYDEEGKRKCKKSSQSTNHIPSSAETNLGLIFYTEMKCSSERTQKLLDQLENENQYKQKLLELYVKIIRRKKSEPELTEELKTLRKKYRDE